VHQCDKGSCPVGGSDILTKGKVKAYFKNGAGVVKSSGWTSYVKRAPVTPPAHVVRVGGSSRLLLDLRLDFFPILNLSRVGSSWSFTRPLILASTLPTS